jgi:GIY-YIG catalytic domain-containing protein
MKAFVLYGLRKSGEEFRYVGITSTSLKNRLTNHLCSKTSPYKDRWITIACKGIPKPKSPEHRKNLSLAHLGKRLSSDHKAELSRKRSLWWEKRRQESMLLEMWGSRE